MYRLAITVLLVCATSCQSQQAPPKVVVMYCGAQNAPAKIVDFNDVPGSMGLKNTGTLGITAYRIDSFVIRGKNSAIRTGRWMTLSTPLQSGQATASERRGPRDTVGKPPDRIIFFISELAFSDGSRWTSEYLKGNNKGEGCLEG